MLAGLGGVLFVWMSTPRKPVDFAASTSLRHSPPRGLGAALRGAKAILGVIIGTGSSWCCGTGQLVTKTTATSNSPSSAR